MGGSVGKLIALGRGGRGVLAHMLALEVSGFGDGSLDRLAKCQEMVPFAQVCFVEATPDFGQLLGCSFDLLGFLRYLVLQCGELAEHVLEVLFTLGKGFVSFSQLLFLTRQSRFLLLKLAGAKGERLGLFFCIEFPFALFLFEKPACLVEVAEFLLQHLLRMRAIFEEPDGYFAGACTQFIAIGQGPMAKRLTIAQQRTSWGQLTPKQALRGQRQDAEQRRDLASGQPDVAARYRSQDDHIGGAVELLGCGIGTTDFETQAGCR